MKKFSPKKLDDFINKGCLKQAAIARKAGLKPNRFHEILNGDREPKINAVVAIAAALGKPIDFFLEEVSLVDQKQLNFTVKSKKVVNAI